MSQVPVLDYRRCGRRTGTLRPTACCPYDGAFSVSLDMQGTSEPDIPALLPIGVSAIAATIKNFSYVAGAQATNVTIYAPTLVAPSPPEYVYGIKIDFPTVVEGYINVNGGVRPVPVVVPSISTQCDEFRQRLQTALAAPSGSLYTAIVAAYNNACPGNHIATLTFSTARCYIPPSCRGD